MNDFIDYDIQLTCYKWGARVSPELMKRILAFREPENGHPKNRGHPRTYKNKP